MHTLHAFGFVEQPDSLHFLYVDTVALPYAQFFELPTGLQQVEMAPRPPQAPQPQPQLPQAPAS